ncbi:MAG: hypothetical protein OQK27_01105 [Gammaproteobacteria bacterium]|nr:hypothetical protein [Gammaproteobacteria bacterium]
MNRIARGCVLFVLAWSGGQALAGGATPLTPGFADTRPQINPRVAYDGKETFLVVWQQGRHYHEQQEGDILALRLDLEGRPLDDRPLRVCTHAGSQERPRVVFSDGYFHLAWQDLRNGRDWDVYGARIDPDGTLLDEEDGVALAAGAGNQAVPVLAAAEGGALLVWQHSDGDGFYELRGVTLSAEAVGEALPLVHAGGNPGPWYGYSPGFGFLGEPLTQPPRHDEHLRGGGVALARAGAGWLLSWNDEANWGFGGATGITRRFARLTRHGERLVVEDVHRAPTPPVGQRGGDFAVGPDSSLYASAGTLGRGKEVATAILFSNRGPAVPRPNPNREPERLGSGWDPEHTALIFDHGLQVQGPVAATLFGKAFTLVTPGLAAAKPPHSRRLYLSRLAADGRRLDNNATVIHEGLQSPANPDIAASPEGLLLVFEQGDENGHRRIWNLLLGEH